MPHQRLNALEQFLHGLNLQVGEAALMPDARLDTCAFPE